MTGEHQEIDFAIFWRAVSAALSLAERNLAELARDCEKAPEGEHPTWSRVRAAGCGWLVPIRRRCGLRPSQSTPFPRRSARSGTARATTARCRSTRHTRAPHRQASSRRRATASGSRDGPDPPPPEPDIETPAEAADLAGALKNDADVPLARVATDVDLRRVALAFFLLGEDALAGFAHGTILAVLDVLKTWAPLPPPGWFGGDD